MSNIVFSRREKGKWKIFLDCFINKRTCATPLFVRKKMAKKVVKKSAKKTVRKTKKSAAKKKR
jgi:hypothetical protein